VIFSVDFADRYVANKISVLNDSKGILMNVMKTRTRKTDRSKFFDILLGNKVLNAMPIKRQRFMMKKIMDDLDKDGTLDPINYDDEMDTIDDALSEIEFDTTKTPKEKALAIEFLTKTKEEEEQEFSNVISLQSLERIRKKRIEMSEDIDTEIILTPEDTDPVSDTDMPNSYGRSSLHEAIGMRNLEMIQEYVKEKRYLDVIDNNGNTPYQMAYQEGYEEAIKIFVTAGVAV
jgi:ankyrin repeat protein